MSYHLRCLAFFGTITSVVSAEGCRPDLEDDAALVSTPRILAVRAEPAEARPNDKVTFTALYTDGSRAVADAALGWRFCTARRALAEPQPIDPDCLAGTAASSIGRGPQVSAVVPRDACRVFGPDRPLAKPGEPAGRPADPDGTGGFFQPGIVDGARASPALFELRVRCALPSATQAIALDFEERYRPNENPTIANIERVRGGSTEPVPENTELRVAPGETVRLRVSWPDCPDSAPCGGAEHYVSYDTGTRALVDRREAMTIEWLTTSGNIPLPRTGRDESDPATNSENDFTAPHAAGTTSLFVVLRDARGGATFRTIPVRAE